MKISLEEMILEGNQFTNSSKKPNGVDRIFLLLRIGIVEYKFLEKNIEMKICGDIKPETRYLWAT